MPDSVKENGAQPVDLYDSALYLNRELSTIEFNRRVFLESRNPSQPLLERLKFSAIFSNNMDEFFMVRVSGIKQQVLLGVPETGPDGLTPREQLAAIHQTVGNIVAQQMKDWRDELMPALKKNDIHILNYEQLKKRQQSRLDEYFEREIFPVLTPLAFDPGRPFPHISNLSLNLAVVIQTDDGSTLFARVKVPNTLPRLVSIKPIDPDELLQPTVRKFVWVEQIIIANLGRLFPGMEIVAAHPFRVTRNTDMEFQEEEADDLMLSMEQSLRQRHFGFVVRLEVGDTVPDWIREILMSNLEVGTHDVYTIKGPLELSNLFELLSVDRPEIKDPPLVPVIPSVLRQNRSIFGILRQQNVLLHHPYDSFGPIVDFVETAANDPKVLAIKQTLYRVGPNPPIVQALMRARENGKQVSVLIELKARFDEESNIEWARALEKAGVHVVYGLVGLKTHAKLCLVVRREKEGLRRYVHMATGNYNSITARVYTDLGYMTSDPDIGADVSEIFNFLTGYSKQEHYRKCLVAPVKLRKQLSQFIKDETSLGPDGHIILKINHLVDPKMIRLLYKASMAGVKVELMIRGICCLRPGIPGVSDNIVVKSTVGRFLEHTRIYYFKNGGDMRLFVGSADLMARNLDRRVEVLFPVEDPVIQREIMDHVLGIYLQDSRQSYLLQESGAYQYIGDADELDEELPLEDDAIEDAIEYEKKTSSAKQITSAQEWYLQNRKTHITPASLGEKQKSGS